jgi:hypothetical protein
MVNCDEYYVKREDDILLVSSHYPTKIHLPRLNGDCPKPGVSYKTRKITIISLFSDIPHQVYCENESLNAFFPYSCSCAGGNKVSFYEFGNNWILGY